MIIILYASISEIKDISIEKRYIAELDCVFNDWGKISNYFKWQDKQSTIVGRFLLQYGLTFYGYEVKKLIFEFTKFGKPYIVNQPIHFNISHSDQIVVCALSDEKVGIDIEKLNCIEIDHFKSFFNLKDYNKIRFSNNKQLAFYNYWTRHESLIKTCEEEFEKDEIIIEEFRAFLKGKVYHYKQLNLVENYICTICTETEIKKMEIIPFHGL